MSRAVRPVVALDVSALVDQRQVTGIQRVILALVPRLCQAAFARGHAVALVDSLRPRLRLLRLWDRPVPGDLVSQGLAQIASGRQLVPPWLRRAARVTAACLGGHALRPLARRIGPLRFLASRGRLHLREARDAWWPTLPRADAYLTFSAGLLPAHVPAGVPPERAVFVLHDLIPVHRGAQFSTEAAPSFAANLARLACAGAAAQFRLVTASRHVADGIRELFWALGRARVAPRLLRWGYARETFYPQPDPGLWPALGLPPEAVVVLAVSTQSARKRFDHVEAALALLAPRLPVHGVFLGQGPRSERPAGRARYLGHVPDDLLRRAYSSCDVFVNWSEAEGFGLPVVEALACGGRVIVPPDNPTLREVGGDNVLVADAATPQGLARAIELAAASRGRPRPLPDLSAFDWDAAALTLLDELGLSAPPAHAAAA